VQQMPLTHNDQLHIIRDLLQDHYTDCAGSPSECAQIERLAAHLIENGEIHEDVRNILANINEYSHTGSSHQHLEEHISNHLPHLESWINTIQTHHPY
jgi:hypothetical protein